MADAVNQNGTALVDGGGHGPATGATGGLVRWLWPPRCLLCRDRGDAGLDLCRACAHGLPWLGQACRSCAIPLAPAPRHLQDLHPGDGGEPQPRPPGLRCGRCLRRPPPLTEAHAACLYGAPLDRLLPRFKFHHDLAAGRLLAQLMAQRFRSLPATWPAAVALLPIPLHPRRLRQRGYDQALELARPLARALDLPLLHDALVRVRHTAPQSRLQATRRQRNLEDAFRARGSAALPAHVVLVDDVMTTGATLHAAAIALHRAGVARVDAWVCARVP